MRTHETASGPADLLRPGEREDDLQRAGLRILQNPSLFCFGMDAVLLSAYVQVRKARRGLDLGTGNGIIPILLSDRTDCARLTGLEIQPASADLAARSVALNGLEDRISIVQGDLREADRIFASASFDFITCNPPYRPAGTGKITGERSAGDAGKHAGKCFAEDAGKPAGKFFKEDAGETAGERSGEPAGECGRETAADSAGGHAGEAAGTGVAGISGLDPRAIARHELLCTFDDVVRVSARLLRPGGHLYLVHRPLRLAEIISKLCAGRLEPKRMRLVYPHADQAPNMVLFDCVRGGAPELRVEPPLIVYEKDGTYTPELMKIYYD